MSETVKVQRNILGALDRVAAGMSTKHDARLLLTHLATLTDTEKALDAKVDDMALTIHVHEKSLDEQAATIRERNDRIDALRARIVELAAMVDMMKDVNAAQAAEIVTLTAEVERLYQQQVYDHNEQMERALRIEAERL